MLKIEDAMLGVILLYLELLLRSADNQYVITELQNVIEKLTQLSTYMGVNKEEVE